MTWANNKVCYFTAGIMLQVYSFWQILQTFKEWHRKIKHNLKKNNAQLTEEKKSYFYFWKIWYDGTNFLFGLETLVPG